MAIHWEHVNFVPQGVEIFIARSKIDQEGEGQVCAIPYGNSSICPVSTLHQWREKSKASGPIFVAINKSDRLREHAISPERVSSILKNLASECQLPKAEEFSAHSLRRGFATSASQKGAGLSAIMRHGRWRSERTVIGYIEEGQRFDDNAAGLLLRPTPE